MQAALPAAALLYSYRRCPYAMRARMALRYSGIAVDIVEVELRNKPERLLAASPKGTVPVLILSEGAVIDESLDIMHWALAQHDPERWLARDQDGLSATLALIAENDGHFKQALDRYKYAERFPERSRTDYRDDGTHFLQTLETLLQSRPYLYGDQPGLADIAIFPFIRQFAAVDAAWFESCSYTRVQQWLRNLVDSALFIAIMQKPTIVASTSHQ